MASTNCLPCSPPSSQYKKPSELLLGALLRSGREKERQFKRKTSKRDIAFSTAVQDEKLEKHNIRDHGVCDSHDGFGKQGCVEARVVKEKALRYQCLSTSLPVNEDVYSIPGCLKVSQDLVKLCE